MACYMDDCDEETVYVFPDSYIFLSDERSDERSVSQGGSSSTDSKVLV